MWRLALPLYLYARLPQCEVLVGTEETTRFVLRLSD